MTTRLPFPRGSFRTHTCESPRSRRRTDFTSAPLQRTLTRYNTVATDTAAFTVSAPVLKAAAAASAGRAPGAPSVAVRASAFEMPSQYKKVRVRDKASPDPTRSATATSGFPPAKEPSEKASLVDKAKVCKSSSTHPRADLHPVSPPQISPVGTQVLVKVAEAEKTTAGGIILAESAQRKPTSGAYPTHESKSVPLP